MHSGSQSSSVALDLLNKPMLQVHQDSLYAHDHARLEPFTVLVLGEACIEALSNLATSTGNQVLARCVAKASRMASHQEMQSFSTEEAYDIEAVGTTISSNDLINFACYIRTMRVVPHIVNFNAITFQKVSLKDFPPSPAWAQPSDVISPLSTPQTSPEQQTSPLVLRTSPRTHRLLASGLEFFRHMEETLIPTKSRNKASNIQQHQTNIRRAAGPQQIENERLIILKMHIPILPLVDRETMKIVAQSFGDQIITNAVVAANEWATGGCALVRATDVAYLLNAAERLKNVHMEHFAQYYECLHKARQTISGPPILFQLTPLIAYSSKAALSQSPTTSTRRTHTTYTAYATPSSPLCGTGGM